MMQQRVEDVEEDEEERRITFRLIEDLQSGGINVSDINKLREAGMVTIGQVLQSANRYCLILSLR